MTVSQQTLFLRRSLAMLPRCTSTSRDTFVPYPRLTFSSHQRIPASEQLVSLHQLLEFVLLLRGKNRVNAFTKTGFFSLDLLLNSDFLQDQLADRGGISGVLGSLVDLLVQLLNLDPKIVHPHPGRLLLGPNRLGLRLRQSQHFLELLGAVLSSLLPQNARRPRADY